MPCPGPSRERFTGLTHLLPGFRKDLSLFSSHAFGVADAIEMARELHQLPPVTILYGIEGEAFDPGVGLSDSVLKSLPRLLAMIEQDLCRLRGN